MTKHHSKTIQIQRICQLTYLEQTNGLGLKTLEPTKLGFQYLVLNLFEDGLLSHPFELVNQKLTTGYVNRVKLSKDQEQVKITIYFKGRPRLTFQGRRMVNLYLLDFKDEAIDKYVVKEMRKNETQN